MPARLKTLLFAGVFACLVALGAAEGRKLQHLSDAERFYRWLDAVTADAFLSADAQKAGAQDESGTQPASDDATGDIDYADQIQAVLRAKNRGSLEADMQALAGCVMASMMQNQTTDAACCAVAGAAVAAMTPQAVEAIQPQDYALYRDVLATAIPLLEGEANEQDAAKRFVAMIQENDPTGEVWRLAQSKALAGHRRLFQEYLADQRLEFARNINVADAQSSGVNLFNLFFGFRKIAANFVWLQVDRYWHMGMNQRMLPLMKTTVLLDPKFVDAYLVGAWHLAYNLTAGMGETKPQDKAWLPEHKALAGEKERYYYYAVDYLMDGVRNNPREYKLYFDLGFAVYKNKIEDYSNAVKYLAKATRLPHERWVPRQLYICYELNKQYREALHGWQDYLKRFPENIVAPRFIVRNKALIEEQEGDRLMDLARATEDPAAAQEHRAAASQAYARAKEIYRSMNEGFADGRLSRIEAVELAEQGRYLEAIALLEHARWQSAAFWDEASKMIMDLKQRAGIPLSQSEKKEVLRQADEVELLQSMQQTVSTPSQQ